jgi:hypothetical protein
VSWWLSRLAVGVFENFDLILQYDWVWEYKVVLPLLMRDNTRYEISSSSKLFSTDKLFLRLIKRAWVHQLLFPFNFPKMFSRFAHKITKGDVKPATIENPCRGMH